MASNTAKIIVNDDMVQEFKDTCIKWDPVLQQLPIRRAQDVLQHFVTVTGLRGKRRFGTVDGNSQFAPFKKHRTSDADVNINFRELETFHGNVIETFAPVDYIDMPFAYDDPVISDAIKKAGSTLMVLAQLTAARGQYIAQAAFTGKRNPDGDTTEDLCDGLLTIIAKEIEAGNLTEGADKRGNLYVASELPTAENAVDLAKDILFTSNPFLRRENNVLLCSTDFADKYNEAYLATHTGISYNTEYNQPYVEGSGHKLTLIGLPELDGQDYFIMTQKSNLLCGIYNANDTTSVDIKREGHYDLSMASDMWLGFQFRTLDPRRLRVIDFSKAKKSETANTESGKGNESEEGTESGKGTESEE